MTTTEPMPRTVPVAINHVLNLVDCVCTALTNFGAGPTCWCGLYPGVEVAHDYCTDCGNDVCGMGYVRLALGSPYSTFPNPAIDDRCALPMMWAVEVGALRCMPSSEDGSGLDEQTLAEVSLRTMLDSLALRDAIKCCTGSWGLGPWTPVGPLGMCVGGYWQAFLAVD